MPEKLARLTAIGFFRIGSWKLTDRGLTFEIDEQLASARNVLYAFAVDGSLAYIGKTTVPLRDRLQRYKTPAKSAEKGGRRTSRTIGIFSRASQKEGRSRFSSCKAKRGKNTVAL